MRQLARWTVIALTMWIMGNPTVRAREAGSDEDLEGFFERRIRPVLAGTCVKCHGPLKASAGLRLDSREAMLKGGETGPAVVPGDAKASLLLQAVEHEDESLEMPPGKLLPKSVRADLAAWVLDGAKWPKSVPSRRTVTGQKHWAFEPFSEIVPPDDPTGWSEQALDRFIAARQRAHGLRPAPNADRRA